MRTYADSSFICRLLLAEAESAETIGVYRRANRPALFFTPLHAIEVRAAILQRAHHDRSALGSAERPSILRRRDTAFARLKAYQARSALIPADLSAEETMARAETLIGQHTEATGLRSLDAIHVALALMLECELFLTTDSRQAGVAKAEGLKVMTS